MTPEQKLEEILENVTAERKEAENDAENTKKEIENLEKEIDSFHNQKEEAKIRRKSNDQFIDRTDDEIIDWCATYFDAAFEILKKYRPEKTKSKKAIYRRGGNYNAINRILNNSSAEKPIISSALGFGNLMTSSWAI